MNRTEKQAFVGAFHDALKQAGAVVVSHYRGLTVAQLTDLRVKMREEGGQVRVAKNRLAKLAFKDTPYVNLEEYMSGPTVVTWAADPVTAAKVTHKFAKDNDKLVIIGGAVKEEKLDIAGIKNLASLPSLDELRAKLIGLLTAPAQRMATVTQAPAAGLARQLAQKPENV